MGNALILMLPTDLSAKVIDWGKTHIGEDLLSGLPNKGRENGPHITLATGINDEEPEKIFKLMESCKPMEVTLGDIDCFRKTEKGYDVIKINVESPELQKLFGVVLDNIAVDNPIIPYKPHITLAYVKPSACDGLLGNKDFSGMKVPIESYLYSDRETGGRVVPFKKGEPLKESLDYGIKEVSEYAAKNGLNIKVMSSMDIAKIILSIHSSNKS